MKAQLQDGYTVEIPDSVADDWSFLKILRQIDKGETSMVVDAAEFLLGGPDEVDKLADHLKDETGHTSIEAMVSAIAEILTSAGELKNS